MTREEAKKILEAYIACESKKAHFECNEYNCDDSCPLLYDMGTVGEYNEAINMAIQALEQEPKYCDRNICMANEYNGIGCDECEVTKSQELCEDAMNRILKRMWNCRGKHTTSIDKVKMEQILRDELLSVNPQPKTGHWINISNKDLHDYRTGNKLCFECSECRSQYTYKSNYCPNCGMVEEQKSDHTCYTCKHYTSGERDGSCGSYICKGYSNWESEG